MIDYITYEDLILTHMNNVIIKKENDQLVELFKTLWSEFQDKWEDELWDVYNKLRSRGDRKRLNSTAENSIEEDFEKLHLRKLTSDEVYL
jgi:hypothetical protein